MRDPALDRTARSQNRLGIMALPAGIVVAIVGVLIWQLTHTHWLDIVGVAILIAGGLTAIMGLVHLLIGGVTHHASRERPFA